MRTTLFSILAFLCALALRVIACLYSVKTDINTKLCMELADAVAFLVLNVHDSFFLVWGRLVVYVRVRF